MASSRKPNPFAKVTEEASEPEHERRLIRSRAMAERKMAEKRAATARKAKLVDMRAAANEAPPPSTSTPTEAKKSTKATTLAPLRKKRSGLRGVALTFGHYGVKKVVRRPSAVLMQNAKVPRVPRLPGQEDVPVTDSEQEEGGHADDQAGASEPEDDGSADADGKPDTWEKGSQGSTVIEDASDREDFDVEYGVPSGSAENENQDEPDLPDLLPPLHPQGVVKDTPRGHANPQVALDEQSGFGLPGPYTPAPTPATASVFNLPPPASHGMPQQPPAKHPFGPTQTFQPMATGNFSPDEMTLMNMPFPNNPAPMDFLNHSQGVPSWSWVSDLPERNQLVGVNVARPPNFAFGIHNPPHANAAFDPPDQFDPQSSSFLEQLASEPPELNSTAYEPLDRAATSTPASPVLHADARPIAPLPRPRVTTTAPSTPRVSSSHLTTVSRAATPTVAQALQSGRNPSPSFPLLANDHARVFTRSLSAPFEASARRPSLQLGSSHTRTRPGTPIDAVPVPNDDDIAPPPSPLARDPSLLVPNPFVPEQPLLETGMQAGFGADESTGPLSGEQEAIHAEIPAVEVPAPASPPFIVDEPSASLHMSKRARLVPHASHAPTLKEIRLYKAREYAAIRKRRKCGKPAPSTPTPRVGTHLGLFSKPHQEYMFTFRSSLTADVVMRSPWSESEADMVERAAARSDAATGLRKEDVIQGEFEATAMRGLSNCRSHFSEPVLQIVKNIFKEVDKAGAQALLAGDRFMYPTNAKHPRDFGDTPAMREVTKELFFSNGGHIGGLFMEEMLQEDSLEARRKLLTLIASAAGEPVPSSFDYANMSPDALRGPPLASLAFAGIAIRHALKRIAGKAGNFDEPNYGDTWVRYVQLLVSHPRLGAIRGGLFEEMKLRYSSIYCQGNRYSSAREPRAWEWK